MVERTGASAPQIELQIATNLRATEEARPPKRESNDALGEAGAAAGAAVGKGSEEGVLKAPICAAVDERVEQDHAGQGNRQLLCGPHFDLLEFLRSPFLHGGPFLKGGGRRRAGCCGVQCGRSWCRGR